MLNQCGFLYYFNFFPGGCQQKSGTIPVAAAASFCVCLLKSAEGYGIIINSTILRAAPGAIIFQEGRRYYECYEEQAHAVSARILAIP